MKVKLGNVVAIYNPRITSYFSHFSIVVLVSRQRKPIFLSKYGPNGGLYLSTIQQMMEAWGGIAAYKIHC